MFDIREYFQNNNFNKDNSKKDLSHIDEDISSDLDNLLKSRFDSLYKRDKYKSGSGSIDIIYPRIAYPGSRSMILDPDKIRFLLSFYPDKNDIKAIDKIVIRPRYIEVGKIELSSLYLADKKILVLYLTQPYYYSIYDLKHNFRNKFETINLDKIFNYKQLRIKTDNDGTHEIRIFPLWYILSVLSMHSDSLQGVDEQGKSKVIEKFFIKKTSLNRTTYQQLNDISFYYSRHGY